MLKLKAQTINILEENIEYIYDLSRQLFHFQIIKIKHLCSPNSYKSLVSSSAHQQYLLAENILSRI